METLKHRCGSSDFCIPNWVSCCSFSVSLFVVGARAVLWKVLEGLKLALLPPRQVVWTWAQPLICHWECEGGDARKTSIRFEDGVNHGD